MNKTSEEKLIVISGQNQQQEIAVPEEPVSSVTLESIDEQKELNEQQQRHNIEIEYMKFKYEKEIEDLKQLYEEQMALKVNFIK